MTEDKKLLPSDILNIMGGAPTAHPRRSGAEAVDNAIGGHGIDSVVIDEAAGLPDVMVGVEVPEGNHTAKIIDQGLNSDSAAEGNHPVANSDHLEDDAFEVWIYRKIGDGYGQATRARAASAEKAFLYAFEEQGEPNVDAPAPDPNTEEYYERLYHVLREAFTTLANEGFDPIEINASACGMARRSMESLVGKDKAIAWDNFVRKNIGWDKAKARIIYPDQVVRGRNGKQS